MVTGHHPKVASTFIQPQLDNKQPHPVIPKAQRRYPSLASNGIQLCKLLSISAYPRRVFFTRYRCPLGSDTSTITAVFHRLEVDGNLQGNTTDLSEQEIIRQEMDPDFHRHIENWIPTASSRSKTHVSESAPATTRTQMTPSQSTFEMTMVGYEDQFSDEDSEKDGEFEYEILQGCLDKGIANYEVGDWASAEPRIRRALDCSKKLSVDKVRLKGINLEDTQFKSISLLSTRRD